MTAFQQTRQEDHMHKPRIGIVIGTTRPDRFADKPTQWILQVAQRRDDAIFETVDLRDYVLPFFEDAKSPVHGPSGNAVVRRWADRIGALDGFIFLTAEYNHSISGVLKNALDHVYVEFNRKPASFVGYGGVGGARAVEHLRGILAELQVASLKHAVHIGPTEFIGIRGEGKTFADYPHLAPAADAMLDELVWWTNALLQARSTRP